MVEVSVRAAATPDVLDRVLDELEPLWARQPGVPTGDRRRFETGLVEILGNVVAHAGIGSVEVDVDVAPDAVTAVLRDHGRSFDFDPRQVTMPGSDAESGRGLALALDSLDHLEHERVEGCNRWTLRCDLTTGGTHA